MNTYKVIIIDDEKKSIEILKNKLIRTAYDIDILHTLNDPIKAVKVLNESNPDIVFLDIAMPKLNGFDLLKRIDNPNFEIIFVTAFDDKAIQAIRHCAIGYLVKPVEMEELNEALTHAVKNVDDKISFLKNKQLIENSNAETPLEKKILLPNNDGVECIKITSVLRCEGDAGYTNIYLRDGTKIVSSLSIGYYQELLGDTQFYMVHRSHVINMDCLKRYENDGFAILDDNIRIPVSRKRRKDFIASLRV